MRKHAFDNEAYLKIQQKEIEKRISSFDNKLYLEVGGKLFDDYHASRVLPGFKKDSKVRVLSALKDKIEIIVVISSEDIANNKIRNDLGITYDKDAERLIDAFNDASLYVSSVVLSFYFEDPKVDAFKNKLEKNGYKVYKHYRINGYPNDLGMVCSDLGLGKNEYVETSRPLVVVTAPGPGSGKMGTCLSQLYHDYKRNIKSGYAKFETFPVWNLDVNHPVNVAYEAATADLNDNNAIDPYHLKEKNIKATNYNRDIESYPLLKSIFEKIYGKSPYVSPTDMGVNMVGFAISDEEYASKCSKQEVIRRYYQSLKNNLINNGDIKITDKLLKLMGLLNITINDRLCVKPCLEKELLTNVPCVSIELQDGRIITGKKTDLLTAPASCLINALKVLGNIDDDQLLLYREVLEPINKLKINNLHTKNPRLHVHEILIALAIEATTIDTVKKALDQLVNLKDTEAHSSVILASEDLNTFKKLGINVTEEPVSYAKKLYNS